MEHQLRGRLKRLMMFETDTSSLTGLGPQLGLQGSEKRETIHMFTLWTKDPTEHESTSEEHICN